MAKLPSSPCAMQNISETSCSSEVEESLQNGETNAIKVSTNWNVDNQRTLRDSMKFSLHNTDDDGAEDMESLVSLESCVHLVCPFPKQNCSLNFSCDTTAQLYITRIVVVSEAKNLEIYTDHGEYYTTICAEFIDKFDDDFIVYKGIIIFDKPVAECTIKFASVRKTTAFWLYGMKLSVTKSLASRAAGVDLLRVHDRLKKSDHQLTGRAEKFLQYLQKNKTVLKSDVDPVLNVLHSMDIFSSLLRNEPFNVLKNQKNGQRKLLINHDQVCAEHIHEKVEGLSSMNNSPREKIDSRHVSELQDNLAKKLEGSLSNETLSSDDSEYRKELLENITQMVRSEVKTMEDRLWEKIDNRFTELEDKQKRHMAQLCQYIDSAMKQKST